MHPITQFTGGAAIAAAALALGVTGTKLGAEMSASTIPVSRAVDAPKLSINIGRCTEDMPCWTWSRMGNGKRAVLDLSTGQRVVVGACTFRHMWMHGNADLHRADQRMRGDWWAIHHGCDSTRPGGPAIHPSGVVED